MTQNLIEAVARAISEMVADPEDKTILTPLNFYAETWIDCEEIARAALTVAIETCAGVAASHRAPDGLPQIDYDQACYDIEEAIRNLLPKEGETR